MTEETPYREAAPPLADRLAEGRAKLAAQHARDNETRSRWAQLIADINESVGPTLRCEVRESAVDRLRWAMLVGPLSGEARLLTLEYRVDELDRHLGSALFADAVAQLEAAELAATREDEQLVADHRAAKVRFEARARAELQAGINLRAGWTPPPDDACLPDLGFDSSFPAPLTTADLEALSPQRAAALVDGSRPASQTALADLLRTVDPVALTLRLADIAEADAFAWDAYTMLGRVAGDVVSRTVSRTSRGSQGSSPHSSPRSARPGQAPELAQKTAPGRPRTVADRYHGSRTLQALVGAVLGVLLGLVFEPTTGLVAAGAFVLGVLLRVRG